MKSKLSVPFLVLTALLIMGPFILAAQTPAAPFVAGGQPNSQPIFVLSQPPAAGDAASVLTPLLQALTGKFGWLVTVIAVMGTLRLVIKPIVAAVHASIQASGNTKLEAIDDEVEQSTPFKWTLFALDWLGSIKLTPTVKVVTVPPPPGPPPANIVPIPK